MEFYRDFGKIEGGECFKHRSEPPKIGHVSLKTTSDLYVFIDLIEGKRYIKTDFREGMLNLGVILIFLSNIY